MGLSALLGCISSGGILRCPYIFGRKFGARMMRSAVNSSSSAAEADESSTLPSRISPWLMLPPAFEGGDNMVYKFYSLAEKKVMSINKGPEIALPIDEIKFVGSSHGWLALFDQRNNDLYLSNPLSRRHIKLPPIHTLPYPEINSVSKVIISSSPDGEEEEEECRAMMTVGPGERLAFCVPGRSTEWTPIGEEYFRQYEDDEGTDDLGFRHRRRVYNEDKDPQVGCNRRRAYEDFVYCSGGKFISCTTQLKLDLRGWRPYSPTELEDWDLRDPRSPRVRVCDWMGLLRFYGESCSWLLENNKLLRSCRQIPCLVDHNNQLFIVIRFVSDKHPYKTVGFSVFRVDYEKGHISNLRLVEEGGGSLDGLAMFVGMNSHSFAMPAADFPELKPNSIYFTDANRPVVPVYAGHDVGIFDYKNKTLSPCYYPCHDLQSLTSLVFVPPPPPPMWFTPCPH